MPSQKTLLRSTMDIDWNRTAGTTLPTNLGSVPGWSRLTPTMVMEVYNERQKNIGIGTDEIHVTPGAAYSVELNVYAYVSSGQGTLGIAITDSQNSVLFEEDAAFAVVSGFEDFAGLSLKATITPDQSLDGALRVYATDRNSFAGALELERAQMMITHLGRPEEVL